MFKTAIASILILCSTSIINTSSASEDKRLVIENQTEESSPKTRVLSANEMLTIEMKSLENDQTEEKKEGQTFLVWHHILSTPK